MSHAGSGGTPVTLTVTQSGTTAPPPPTHPHGHLPFTGFSLVAVLLLVALLLLIGSALVFLGRPAPSALAPQESTS